MKVLVACEFSGRVRDAFLAQGHDALSCDIVPTESPGPHYQGDVRDLLTNDWDMLIAFPPCIYLAYSGNAHWNDPGRAEKREQAIKFARLLWNAPIPRIALENPRGILSHAIRKPDQIIHPSYFGHSQMKRTCLWLKNLPPLMSTCIAVYPMAFVDKLAPTKDRAKIRSLTFPGIAEAMATQWNYL
jgi:hypothetical protein